MRRSWSVIAGLGVLLSSAVASAQTPPFNQNMDIQAFRPAPGPYNFLTVSGSRVDGHLAISLGAWANYAYRGFSIYNASCPNADNDVGCVAGDVRSRPVEHLATLNLQVTLALFRRLMLSVDLPFSVESGQAVSASDARPVLTSGAPSTQTGVAAGDPRIEARVRIAGSGLQGAGVAASVFGTVPLGRNAGGDNRFLGDASFALGGKLIGDLRHGRFLLGVNVGALYRPDTIVLLSTRVGSRFLWGAAAGYEISPRLTGLLEFNGSSDFSSNVQNNALEADLAARYHLGDVNFTLGGGTGIVHGVGVPVARVFLGAMWAPFRVDADHDGVFDNVDECPTEAEDPDGNDDLDGCPDPDNDGDGVLDADDRCPDEAEDRDNFQDRDGCPDPDNDNDGVPDGFDTCPREPEDRDGDRDEDGCPDDDRDRDGVPDERDRCPNDAEDTDGFQDQDGCPDPDNDNDGIPDQLDQCSDQPETLNNFQDDDGCPDELPDRDHDGIPDDRDRCPDQAEIFNGVTDDDGCPEVNAHVLAEVSGAQIRILRQVNFATNSDRIVGGESFRILDAVLALLNVHPEIRLLEVQGYTDNRGNADANRTLSQRRAVAVRAYLVQHGIAEARLTARGFGPDNPIAPNTSVRGRAANRRVEFHIGTPPRPTVPDAAPAAPATPAPASPAPAPAR